MKFTVKNKKIFIFFLMMVFLLSMFMLAINTVINVDAGTNTAKNVVRPGFSFDFTSYELNGNETSGKASNWNNYAYSYSSVHLSRGSFRALGAGVNNEVYNGMEKHSGEIVYKIVANDISGFEKIFDSLIVNISGRVFHFNHIDCKECYMKLSVGETYSDFAIVSEVFADNNGASSVWKFDITEYAKGKEEVFLKIELSGFENDWVCMEKLNISGDTVYKDVVPVKIEIDDIDKDLLVSLNQKVLLKSATATNGLKTFNYKVNVYDVENNLQQVTDNSFVPTKIGAYKVVYEVNDEGRKYFNDYNIYCVEDSLLSGYVTGNYNNFNKDSLLNVNNYILDDSGNLEKTSDDKLKITGNGAYLLPLEFDRGFNFLFGVNSLKQGSVFEFAFTGKIGLTDFDTKKESGLYYTLKKDGDRLIISGIFQSGEKLYNLGSAGINRLDGIHGMGINRRDTTYTDGVQAYFNGQEILSYQHCVFVELSKFLSENNFYFSFSCVKADIEVDNIKKGDVKNPTLRDAITNEPIIGKDYPKKGNVSDYFGLPNVVMFDEYDGKMPFEIKVTDPYGNNIELEHLSTGDRFFVEYEGRYEIEYISSDYSGNTAHEIKNVMMTLQKGAPQMIFKNKINNYGRKGKEILLVAPQIKVDGNVRDDLIEKIEITVTSPEGQILSKKANESFIPDKIGSYKVIYKLKYFAEITENDQTKTKEFITSSYFNIEVKLDVSPENSYKDILNKDNWIKNSSAVMTQDENGLNIYGRTVSALPFDMESGIEITVDLKDLEDKSRIDNWFSIGIGHKPIEGHFADQRQGFVYFMLYFENNHYYVNAAFNLQDGRKGGLFGPIDLGTNSVVTISLEKLYGSPTKTDNINIYLNHIKTAYGTEGLVNYSHLVDGENFAYIAIDAYGTSPGMEAKDFKSVKILEIAKCDQKAPEFSINGEIANSANLGDKIYLPEIKVNDNLDNNFKYLIGLYNPDGKEIDISKGYFVAEEKGIYNLVLKAQDKSGNYTDIIKSIEVSEKSNLALIISCSVSAVVVAVTVVLFIIFYNKKKKKEKTNEKN